MESPSGAPAVLSGVLSDSEFENSPIPSPQFESSIVHSDVFPDFEKRLLIEKDP